MSSSQSGEGEIRQAIVEADLVDCMVALPGQLFYSTQIPVCLWFLARDKANGRFRDRRGETLFVDARKLGTMVDRVRRELTTEDIAKIAGTYHAWRGDPDAGEYADVPGFCKAATAEEIRGHGYVLTPGRYVGAEAAEDDGEPFEEKMRRLIAELRRAADRGAAASTTPSRRTCGTLAMAADGSRQTIGDYFTLKRGTTYKSARTRTARAGPARPRHD